MIFNILLKYFRIANRRKLRYHLRKMEGFEMKKVLSIAKFMYFFTCWWFFLTLNVHAYIDPSAVTYIIQAVAAVFIALGAMVTVFRHKIFAFFKKKTKKIGKKEIHLKEPEDEV